MYVECYVVDVVTDASGNATAFTPVAKGAIQAIQYTADPTTPFAAGVDFTITTDLTVQNVWVESNVNASKTVCPRQPTHDALGVASLYAAGGEPVEDRIFACVERVKIAIAQGGNVLNGKFRVFVGG